MWEVAEKTAELKLIVVAAVASVATAADYQICVATVGLSDQGAGIESYFAVGSDS